MTCTWTTAHLETPLSSSWSLQTTPHWSASFRMVTSLLTDRRLRSWLSGAVLTTWSWTRTKPWRWSWTSGGTPCRTSTSNAVKAELLKSSKIQLTPVTIFSVYCHLASASGAWWQKLRDWGGASSLRPSGSLTQTQSHKLRNSLTQTQSHKLTRLLTVKHPYSHHPYCCFVYIPSTTRLHIPLAHPSCSYYYIKPQYTVFCTSYCFLHILLFCTFYSITFYSYLSFFTIYMLLCCYFHIIFIFILLHCPLSGPDFSYISLLIIPCINFYVTNKETLNLEPCSLPLIIMNSTVTAVESFRFLGTTISQDLKWDNHIDSIVKKTQQRSYFLHQLRKFNLPQELLKQFYSAIIESILCTSITVWFNSATKSDLRWLRRVVRTGERIIATTLPTLQELYSSRVSKRAGKITLDLTSAHSLFELLPSGRRFRTLSTRTTRHRNSFFPQAIHLMDTWH